MITELGNLDPQHLGVIARTSVIPYKHRLEQTSDIGRELGVQYVLEGSVRRDTGKVRITAQLIQVKDQSHLWARDYDRQLKDLLTLQGEIAREIAEQIQLTLGERKPSASAHGAPLSAKAYGDVRFISERPLFLEQADSKGFPGGDRVFSAGN